MVKKDIEEIKNLEEDKLISIKYQQKIYQPATMKKPMIVDCANKRSTTISFVLYNSNEEVISSSSQIPQEKQINQILLYINS